MRDHMYCECVYFNGPIAICYQMQGVGDWVICENQLAVQKDGFYIAQE